jgi:hypothetical protein
MRLTAALAIACAPARASGSARRIAITAELSTITEAARPRRTTNRHDQSIGTVPEFAMRSLSQSQPNALPTAFPREGVRAEAFREWPL